MFVTRVEELNGKEIEVSYNNSLNVVLTGRVTCITPLIAPEDSPILTVERIDGTVAYFPFNSLFSYKVIPFSPTTSALRRMNQAKKLIDKVANQEVIGMSNKMDIVIGDKIQIYQNKGGINWTGKVIDILPAGYPVDEATAVKYDYVNKGKPMTKPIKWDRIVLINKARHYVIIPNNPEAFYRYFID
jgi:hypothetical protein